MPRRPTLSLAVTVVFASACATNPARRITANDEEVQIHEESAPEPLNDGDTEHPQATLKAAVFTRGAEHLDEQEFYESIDDSASVEKVEAYRHMGSTFQKVGVALAFVGFLAGIAGIGSYVLSDTDTFGASPPIPVPSDFRDYTLYGGIAAAVLGAAGIALTLAMGPRVRGDSLLFDLGYARNRMEVARYGEKGASPDDVKSLSFGDGDDGKLLCGAGSLTLAPLVAKDSKGRVMKVSNRADWFTWTTTPRSDLVTHAPDAPVLSSPVGESFADVDAKVGVTILVPSSQVGHAMMFAQTFACDTELSNSGAKGASGEAGQAGASGSSGSRSRGPGSGASGGSGGDGANGGDGRNLVAEVAWVKSAKRSHLALIVAEGHARLFDPSKSFASISAAGGRGGRGGSGGHGGSGGRGSGGDCQVGGNGGLGGPGGRGGNGGRGGHVELRSVDAALLAAIHAQAPGGEGGAAGSGGHGGSKGSGTAGCPKGGSIYAADGSSGADGSEGSGGAEGAAGTVETKVVSASAMRQIAKVLAANPELSLETQSGNVAAQARPGKKHR